MIEGGPLFQFRFKLQTLLYAVTSVGLFLALCPRLTEIGLLALMYAFMALSLALLVFAVGMATRNRLQDLGTLVICHLAIASFLLVGPILSYHVNGPAWYDYGLESWNPPPFHLDNGSIAIRDYDPKFTRPGVWPVVGPIMLVMTHLSIGLVIVPPTAPVVCGALLALAIRFRHVMTTGQSLCVWTSWAVGSVPVIYMLLWGLKVLEWIAD